MRHLFLFLFIIAWSSSASAQDTIIKNNSDRIIAKIIEISPTEIKFKKFAFLDGPTYIEMKSDVKMIVYSNGTKEVIEQKPAPVKVIVPIADNNIDYYGGTNGPSNKIEILGKVKFRQNGNRMGERKMQTILLMTKDKKIGALISESKKYHALQYVGFAAIPLGIAALGLWGSSAQYSYNGTITYNEGRLAAGTLCFFAGVACPIASGIYKKKRFANNRAAIKLYNEKF